MKKILCVALVVVFMCSVLAVNASAQNVYECEGVELVTDYTLDFRAGSSGYGEGFAIAQSGDLSGELDIHYYRCPGDAEEYYNQNATDYSHGETVIGGSTVGYVEEITDYGYYYEAHAFAGDYYYNLSISADDIDSYETWLEILNGITFTNYEYESSTYWETKYFSIDSNEEFVFCKDEGTWVGEDYYYFSKVVDDELLGEICVHVCYGMDVEEDYEELVDELEGKIKKVEVSGYEAVKSSYDTYCNILTNDGETIYEIRITANDKETFKELCSVAENDLRFNNASIDDDEKSEKKDKKDHEDSKDNIDKDDNTTIIIVAIVVGGVVVLGLGAMIIFGKRKK